MDLKKILGFALGPVAGAAFGLITVPVVAWAFSAADVGRLNILLVTQSFGLLLVVLGLDQAYVREFHESKNRARLLKACFAPGFVFLLLGAALTIPFRSEVSNIIYGAPDSMFFWLTLASIVAVFLSRFLSLILRMQERGLAFSMSQVVPKALLLLLLGGVVLFDLPRSFRVLLWLSFLSTLVVAAVYAWNTRGSWLPAFSARLDKHEVKSLLEFGFPLIFSGLAFWGLAAAATIALRTWSTLDNLAIYSVANSFAGAAVVLQSIFTVVWAPTVYKWSAQGVDLQVVDRVALQILALIGVFLALCGAFSWVCDWLLPAHYAHVKYLVPCMMMQPLLYTLSEVTCVGIAIQRRTIWTVWITLAAMVTNMLLCMLLVPRHGATGAAAANALAFTVFFVARTEVSARIWRPFPRAQLYFAIVVFVGLAVAMAFWGDRAPILAHATWGMLLVALLYVFRDQWRAMLEFVKRSRLQPGHQAGA